jgi:hypothetical protein
MKIGYRFSILAAVMPLLGVAAAAYCSDRSLPSDSILLKQFATTRACFEKIVMMAREERDVERISSTFVRLNDNFMPSSEQRRERLSDDRWNSYRSLFQCARVPNGIGIGLGVYFYAAGVGFAGSGQGKGYLWTVTPPKPLVGTLDGKLPYDKDGSVDVFRHIKGPWYLEYDAS